MLNQSLNITPGRWYAFVSQSFRICRFVQMDLLSPRNTQRDSKLTYTSWWRRRALTVFQRAVVGSGNIASAGGITLCDSQPIPKSVEKESERLWSRILRDNNLGKCIAFDVFLGACRFEAFAITHS